MSDETKDFEARAQLGTHIEVCTERYGNIWQALNDIKSTMQANNTVTHNRFTAISNRMWAAVATVCGASVLGLAAVTFHLLTRSHP